MTGSPSVLCIGPSPSLDRTLVLDRIALGSVNRAKQVIAQPGGKAANVAKVVAALGGASVLCGPVGGGTGDEIKRLAQLAGLDCRWVESSLPTRVCTTIVDSQTAEVNASQTADGNNVQRGTVTDFNEPGAIDEAGWSEFLKLVAELTAPGVDHSRVLLSGSLPAVGAREAGELMGELTRSIESSAELWVDTSWAALAEIIDGDRSVTVLKVNLSEALEYLGHDWQESVLPESDYKFGADLVLPEAGVVGSRAATELAKRIDGTAVVTLGSGGAVLSGGQAWWWGKVDAPRVLNPTGSGDSFFAGLALAWEEGPVEALRLALACGASNAAHLSAGMVEPDSVAELTRLAVVVEGSRQEGNND